MQKYILIFVMFIFLANCDVVKNQYSTLEDARRDRLFERGWLPDILPPSARNIRTLNDLDANISEGEFSFDASEFPLFMSKVASYTPSDSPIHNWKKLVQQKMKDGYIPYQHMANNSIWIFFCRTATGHCEYRMWLSRRTI